jgi:hypothetical protein
MRKIALSMVCFCAVAVPTFAGTASFETHQLHERIAKLEQEKKELEEANDALLEMLHQPVAGEVSPHGQVEILRDNSSTRVQDSPPLVDSLCITAEEGLNVVVGNPTGQAVVAEVRYRTFYSKVKWVGVRLSKEQTSGRYLVPPNAEVAILLTVDPPPPGEWRSMFSITDCEVGIYAPRLVVVH